MIFFRKKIFDFYAPVGLIILGLLQPLGYILNLKKIREVGSVFVASPLPLVFSQFRGLETFSSQFSVVIKTIDEKNTQITLNPKNYSFLEGPYNRRNVYGAVLAYGPKLNKKTEPKLVQSVLEYCFCKSNFPQSIGIHNKIKEAEIQILNLYSNEPLNFTMKVKCQ